MPSAKHRKGKGKRVAPGRAVPQFPPPQDGECPQEEIDEWLNCDTPQNDAAARTIIREERRDKLRARRARQSPIENSDYQVPDLGEPEIPAPSPYALPQLAKRVAEMDRIREQRGNPFPYPANRSTPILAVYPEPFRSPPWEPVDSHSSREESNFPQRRSSPPRFSNSNAHRTPRTSDPPQNQRASNAQRKSRKSNPRQKPRASNTGQNPRIFLRLPRRQKTRSPSIDVPVNSSGHFGNIAGEDEVGVIFDYSNLLPKRQGGTANSQGAGAHSGNSQDCHPSQELPGTEEEIDEDNSEENADSEENEDSQDNEGNEDSVDNQDNEDNEDNEDDKGNESSENYEENEDSQHIPEDIYENNSEGCDPGPEKEATEAQGYENYYEDEELGLYSQVFEGRFDVEMENLPPGAEARLRGLEEDQEDEVPVNYSNSNAWGSASDPRSLPKRVSQMGSSAGASSFATSEPDRSYAPAFTPWNQRQDPYQPHTENHYFAFSTAVPMAPQSASWNTMPPPARGESSSTSAAGYSTPRFSSQQESDQGGLDVHAARNQALEGVFNSESVNRVGEDFCPTERGFDDRFEDPRLNIDPNVRANFVPLTQLYSAPLKRSAFEMQNPNLVASRNVTPIASVIGGETVTYTPSPMDERVNSLDRNGNYIGDYQGEISKRLKRQHVEKVAARDREMLEANEAYQTLLAMTPQARTELLERLRKPFVSYGAFNSDQEVMDEIPEVYTRAVSTVRVMNWMDSHSPGAQHTLGTAKALASSTTSPSHVESADESQPFNGFGDLDDFAAGSSFIPLEGSVQRQVERTKKYFQDVMFFGGESAKDQPSQGRNSVRPPLPSQGPDFNSSNSPSSRTESFTTARDYGGANLSSRVPSSYQSGSTARAQHGFPHTKPGQSEGGQFSQASSRGIDDPFTFDDSPQFQIPSDVDIDPAVDLTAHQNLLYQVATSHSRKYGRVVLVRLHEPVKFTPGAIAQRVFGGIVQEMQLFPVQRLAIVVFLHCAEAKAFLRHVKRTREIGNAHEIRTLQIEAGWYKGSEKSAILPAHPNILRHHIALEATRTLQLSHIDLVKSVTQISAELGSRLSKMLLKVILTKPKQRYLQEEQGRKAVVEFASVRDAIEAKDMLHAGTVTAYGSHVAYAADPCAQVAEEKAWCKCLGCLEQRAVKA